MTGQTNNCIARLPDLLTAKAKPMMLRMIEAMRHQIANDRRLVNPPYVSLLLKMSEPRLVREYEAAIKEAMEKIKADRISPPSLALELETGEPADVDMGEFNSSDAAFESLCHTLSRKNSTGIDAFNKDVFLSAIKQALAKTGMEYSEANTLLPYAKTVLNAELADLYSNIEEVHRRAPVMQPEGALS